MNDIRYEMIIYWSEADNAFIVEVPELLSCKQMVKLTKKPLPMLNFVINDWIETAISLGREIPKPKGKLMFE